jgi:hypothetical protein
MTENQEPQGGAYGEQQAEFSDASEPAAEQTTPSGADEAYGEQESHSGAEGTGQSDQEIVEQTQGGFYSDENVEDDVDENL